MTLVALALFAVPFVCLCVYLLVRGITDILGNKNSQKRVGAVTKQTLPQRGHHGG